MGGSEVPPEHLAPPAAVKANDVIAIHGSPDRNGGGPLNLGLGSWLSEAGDRPMHSRDQGRELVGRDLVSPNISSNDIGSEFSIERCSGRFVSHLWLSRSDRQITMPRRNQGGEIGSPYP
jgi:hypothetical protein